MLCIYKQSPASPLLDLHVCTWFRRVGCANYGEGRRLLILKHGRSGVGVVAGFMATSLGMPGPILILYLSGLDLGKDTIRATAIAFLAVANVVALTFHATVFTVDRGVIVAALFLLPIAGLGTWGGHVLSKRLGQESFRHALLALVTASGVYAVINALI